MSNSPTEDTKSILYFKIQAKGKDVDPMFCVSYIQVSRILNRIGKATLHFDAGKVDDLSFPESDSDTFKPGTGIRVSVGYEKGKEKLLFDGMVVSQALQVRGNIRPQLVVECRDYAFPATQGRKNALFQKKSDSAVIKKILGTYGLSVKVDATTIEHESLVQYYCSDWDFIRSRAEAYGLVICTEGKEITVKKPNIGASPVLKVGFGKDLISFNGTLSATEQYTRVEAFSWDAAKQQLVSATGSVPTVNKQGDIAVGDLQKKGGDQLLCQTDATVSKEALKVWADAQALRNGLARYQGDFAFTGNASVEPGSIVTLENMGKRFDGNVYVGGVEHTIERGVWVSRVLMGLLPESISELTDVTAPPASGLLPGIEGLHIGKVKQVNEDPSKEFRILVDIPLLNGAKNSVWARLCTLYATKKAGSFFLPEKGDEVVVGFFNNDPCYPVILGSLFSSKQSPPHTAEAANNLKAIVSREKLTIEFDEEKKILSLFTPGKNRIEMDDKGKRIRLSDQHKNELVMDNSGITLNSCKDISLKAKGNITLDAGMKAGIKAKTDLTAEGLNVKIAAKAGVSVKGNATAELSASGQTTVKGGIVMIN